MDMRNGKGQCERECSDLVLTCQNLPSYLGSFSSKGQLVMSDCSTFDHSVDRVPKCSAVKLCEFNTLSMILQLE